MAQEFKLPDLGEGIHEAEIQEVPVSVGDEVEENDVILTVETDKASVDIPSPFSGTIQDIHVEPGDLVSVGDVLLTFGNGDGATKQAEETTEKPESSGAREERAERKQQEQRQPREAGDQRPVPASPATRRLARELDVDLRAVEGSGPGGRVTQDDVRAFAEESEPARRKTEEAPREKPERETAPKQPLTEAAPELPDFTRWGPVERQPLRSVRRTIAQRMAQSRTQIPHVDHHDEADITELERLRSEYKDELELDSLTLTVFVMKAAVAALREHSRFNASLDVEAGEIVFKQYYHLGMAVDTERGLIVPVIRDVDRKSITELAEELPEVVARAQAGESELDEMQGGTFTITNVGPMGGTHFNPIINYPQAAILGMAQAEWRPVVRADGAHDPEQMAIEPRLILPLVLTFDHRLADGADAARCMSDIVALLEDPDKLMLMM